MKKLSILILAVISLALIALVVFVVNREKSFSPTTSLEECKTLKYNQNAEVNVVFFASKSEAKKYSDFLLEIEPFNKNKEDFNFYYIDDYKPECEIYKNTALLCYSKELIKKASSCPNDYIITAKEKPSEIRSSSYMNVISLNSKHPSTVLAHEFGHAFANLADEYTPAAIPGKSKNCAKNCNDFGSEKDSCFQGCSKENYFRSIENGLMKTLSSKNYGKFNNNIILSRINKTSIKITGQAVKELTSCQKKKYYLIEGLNTQGNITILNKTIETGCVGGNGIGEYEYNLIKDSSVISKGDFNPALIFTDREGKAQIEGEVLESNTIFLLKMPVIKEVKTLEIVKDNVKLAEVNLKDIGARPCEK